MESREELLNMIVNEFTTDDQKMFVDNFHLYIEYGNDNNVYPIDLDKIWKWIGFTKKCNAKQHLQKFYKEHYDYVVSKPLLLQQERINGGQNKEKIMLNVEAFKSMCMTVNTDKGRQTRQYFIKMENVFFKYVKEKDMHKLEENLKTQVEKEMHNSLKKEHKDKPCVYIMRINKINDTDMIIKIGETDDIKQRVSSLKQEYKEVLLLKVFPCIYAHKFEQYLLNRPDVKMKRINGSELLSIDQEFTLDKLIDIIEKNIIRFTQVMISKNDIEFERLKLKQIIIKALTKTQDHALKAKLEKQLDMTENEPQVQPKEPDSNRRVYKYNPNDLKNPISEFNSLREAARSLNNIKIHDYHIRDAAESSTLLEGYRWYIVDNKDINNVIDEISKTNEPMKPQKNRNKGLVAQIDKTKTTILKVFPNQKLAAEAICCAACTLTIAINSSRQSAGFYWAMYDNCSEELKATFTGELPQPLFSSTCSKKVQQIDPETNNVINTFSCIQDVSNIHKISHKMINKLNKSGDIYKKFKWKLIEDDI